VFIFADIHATLFQYVRIHADILNLHQIFGRETHQAWFKLSRDTELGGWQRLLELVLGPVDSVGRAAAACACT
jgi:hypothetical protein